MREKIETPQRLEDGGQELNRCSRYFPACPSHFDLKLHFQPQCSLQDELHDEAGTNSSQLDRGLEEILRLERGGTKWRARHYFGRPQRLRRVVEMVKDEKPTGRAPGNPAQRLMRCSSVERLRGRCSKSDLDHMRR